MTWTKLFKTREAMADWLSKNQHRISWTEIFINNGYGIEYQILRQI